MQFRYLFSCALLTAALPAQAAIDLPEIFQDGAVLQRDRPVPVWGRATPKSTVTASFGGQTKTTTADDKGRWKVELPAMSANAESRTLTVTETGSPPVEVKDVLVGEVWLGSGQSNMEWSVSATRPEDQQIAASGPVPLLRLFQIPKAVSYQRQEKVNAKWTPANPETVKGFSAVAYFYGRQLSEELKVPVGMIHSSWGGSRIEPWLAEEGVAEVKELADWGKRRRASLPGFPEYDQPFRQYLTALREWTTKAELAIDSEQLVPDAPKAPALLNLGSGGETGTYQAMIHPVVPYGLRGFLWYQGESNYSEGMLYASKVQALIAGWRKQFANPDAPFYQVQLAPYNYGPERAQSLPQIWWAQQSILKSVPHTGLAVTNDIGNPKDIHPTNKSEVARRLLQWALADVYGKKGVVRSGPLFSAYKADSSVIHIAFSEIGSGLTTRDGKAPTLFEIAGDDDVFEPADAVISPDGKRVTLKSATIAAPTQARFAWNQIAEPNLMNKEGLPAAAFNTHWPVDPTLGKPVTLGKPFESSDPNTAGWNSGVNDGVYGNAAGSCFATWISPTFPKTVTIDLGSEQSIQTVRFGVPNIGATKTVSVSLSRDGKEFAEVGRNDFAPKVAATKTVRFPARPARYVRATFLGQHAQQDNFDANFGFLSELEAFSPLTP